MKSCECQRGKGGLTSIKNVEKEEMITYRPFPVNRLNINVGERPRVGIPYVRDSNFRNMDINQTLSRDSKFFFRQKGADTARLGQSLPSLPDRRDPTMRGGAQTSLTGVDLGPQLDSTGSGLKEDQIISKVAKQVAHLTGDERAKAIHHFAKMYGYGQDGGSFKSFFKKVGKAAKKIGKDVVKGAKKVGKTAVKVGKKVGKTAVKVGKFIKDKKLISKGADIGAKIAGVLGQEELVAPLEGVSKGAKMLGFGEGQYTRAQQELHGTSAMPAGIDKQLFIPTHPLNFNRARINKI